MFIILLLLTACGPAAKLRRAEKLIKKAEELGAKWHTDSVIVEVPVPVESVRVDTTFVEKPGDTVTIEKDRLKVKYVRLPGDSVYIEGECKADTVRIKVTKTINRTIKAESKIKWWWIILGVLAGAGIVAIFRK